MALARSAAGTAAKSNRFEQIIFLICGSSCKCLHVLQACYVWALFVHQKNDTHICGQVQGPDAFLNSVIQHIYVYNYMYIYIYIYALMEGVGPGRESYGHRV